MAATDHMNYQPWIILFYIGMFATLTMLVASFYNAANAKSSSRTASLSSYFRGLPFEVTYLSYPNKFLAIMGLLFRIAFCVYVVAIMVIWRLIHFDGEPIVTFPFWTTLLSAVFIVSATICSLIGLAYENDRQAVVSASVASAQRGEMVEVVYWSRPTYRFGSFVQIVYTVAGANALYCTVFAYITVDSSFTFWNVTAYFLQSIFFLTDWFFNALFPRWEWILLYEAFIFCYYIVMWALVGSGVLPQYPHQYMRTDRVTSFGYYGVVFLIRMGFYLFWVAIHWLKYAILGHLQNYSEQESIELQSTHRDSQTSMAQAEPIYTARSNWKYKPSAPEV